ncbi:transcription factor ILR3-like [Rutidosis leptorrhynchoides]|uniref:transcription factor ILR3-like n=1 Tax=Rutidosis leptorrhynchoides TaxID=125765 RepID=UPI003A9928B9
MVSPENSNWIYSYGLIDDNVVSVDNFLPPVHGSVLPAITPLIGSSSNPSAEREGPLVDSDGHKETGSQKRMRVEPGKGTSSKACREKLRRDKLNDKFVELASILEPGVPKTDKSAILVDALRMVTQLKTEAKKLKDSNTDLQEKIKEMKSEKNELRDQKQRLRAEKEKLEQQVNSMNTQPSFMAHPPAMVSKLVPVISYPGMAMWQFMPPASVDTSQDHELHPPVA